jgi:hypothetical protein
MTPAQILALPAGPELDRLVAEKVMGWRLDEGLYWLDSAGKRTGWVHATGHDVYGGYRDWRPSTDIAAAWQLLEGIDARGERWYWRLVRDPLGFSCRAWQGHPEKWLLPEEEYKAEGDTAMLAISRCALLIAEKSP